MNKLILVLIFFELVKFECNFGENIQTLIKHCKNRAGAYFTKVGSVGMRV